MAVSKQHFLNLILNRKTQMQEDTPFMTESNALQKRHVASGQQEEIWGKIKCQNKLNSLKIL